MKKRTCSKHFAAVIAIIVAVSLIAPAAQAAPAQPTSPATALVEEGIAALARSEFIPAENQFRRAIALDPELMRLAATGLLPRRKSSASWAGEPCFKRM